MIDRILTKEERHTGDTKVAARDEGASKGQHFRGHEGNVKRLWDGAALLEDVQECLMTGLNGDNGGSCGQEDGVGDEVSCSEVGGDTEILNKTGSGGHNFDALESGIEVELASRERCSSERADGRLKDPNMSIMKESGERWCIIPGEWRREWFRQSGWPGIAEWQHRQFGILR